MVLGTGETTQLLRECLVLREDLNSIPSTDVRWLTTSCISIYRRSDFPPLGSLPQAPAQHRQADLCISGQPQPDSTILPQPRPRICIVNHCLLFISSEVWNCQIHVSSGLPHYSTLWCSQFPSLFFM